MRERLAKSGKARKSVAETEPSAVRRLAIAQAIAERAGHFEHAAPVHAFDTRSHERMGLCTRFGVQRSHVVDPQEGSRPRCGLAVMITQVQRRFAPADPRIEREAGAAAMRPGKREAEEVETERACLILGEDSQDKDRIRGCVCMTQFFHSKGSDSPKKTG